MYNKFFEFEFYNIWNIIYRSNVCLTYCIIYFVFDSVSLIGKLDDLNRLFRLVNLGMVRSCFIKK